MQVQWSSTVPESVAFTAASKAKYADQVAEESRQRTEGRDAGHLYDHHVFDPHWKVCVDANQQADPCVRGGSASMIPPDRIMYVDFLGKKLTKSLSARGHALPYNGSKNLIVAGPYKDGKSPALLWVGALKSREEDGICIHLNEKKQCEIYEVRPQQCKAFPWWGENLATPAAWEKTKTSCPGIDAEDAILIDGHTIRLNIFADRTSTKGFRAWPVAKRRWKR